jgi:AraC-like DNA-binding protein
MPPVRPVGFIDVEGFLISDEWCTPGQEFSRPDGEQANVFFAAEGSFTEERGGERVRREAFQVLLRPPGLHAALRANEQGARGIAIELSPERLAGVQAAAALFRSSIEVSESGARALARRLSREVGCAWPSKLRLEATILELLAHLAPPDSIEPAWTHAVASAAEHAASASDVSRAVGVSASRIARYVREHHGCTVPAYVRRCRIAAAAEALVTSDRSIAQISTEFGFYDQSHFSKSFKSELGKTPNQYRREFGRS